MKDKGKIYAISDCHGEIHKLKNLFEKLSFTKNDTIVFLGDYIDRGKDGTCRGSGWYQTV